MTVEIVSLNSAAGLETVSGGSRPRVNKRTGQTTIVTKRGMRVNSVLRKDEWESLDNAVVEAAKYRLNGVQHLRERNLTKNEGSIGVLVSQWNTISEMTEADVNMSGRSRAEQDRLDYNLEGRPLPVISKPYTIGERELTASRAFGSGLDVTHAAAASRVVAEKLETLLFEGDSTLTFNGNTIYGYTTEPNRNTDTATNYGGGDWGTVANPPDTVAGMIDAAQGANYFGPYVVYAATTQYNEARNSFNTDGSGDTPYDRILRLTGIEAVYASDTLDDGEILLVNMTRDVVDIAQVPGWELANLEWASGDGMTSYFRVVTIAVPRVKSDYNGNSGIVHATGA